MIAALFVVKDGCYYGLEDVDPWDKGRDARKYAGPWPVVAHPPCERWSMMNHVSKGKGRDPRWGQDDGCFESALHSVRAYGGVLEHPAESRAFATYGLARPVRGWQQTIDGGWVTEVNQAAYGHVLDKRTWLYFCGRYPAPLIWNRVRGTHQMGTRADIAGRPEAKKSLRWKTPVAFRDILISLAESACLVAR